MVLKEPQMLGCLLDNPDNHRCLLGKMSTQSCEMLKDSCVSFLGLQGLWHFGNAGELLRGSMTVMMGVKQGLSGLGEI